MLVGDYMKKKLIIFSSLIFLILTITTIVFIIINQENKYEKISYEKFSSMLMKCDTSNNVTIEENINDNLTHNIYKIDNNKYSIKAINSTDNETIYYKKSSNILYKYYYDDSKWLRKQESENSLYRINLDLIKFEFFYDSFQFNEKDNEYYLISDDTNLKNIKLTFKYDNVYSYEYNDNTNYYKYIFTYYNSTKITLPSVYSDIYDKASEDGWELMLSNTINTKNFSFTSIKEKKENETIVSSYALIGKVDGNKKILTEIKSGDTTDYFYTIENQEEIIYKNENAAWNIIEVKQTEIEEYNQFSMLPIQLLKENYTNMTFNEYASSYEVENVIYNNSKYEKISLFIENGLIVYISLKYKDLFSNDNIYYIEIIDFDDFSNTKIDEILN